MTAEQVSGLRTRATCSSPQAGCHLGREPARLVTGTALGTSTLCRPTSLRPDNDAGYASSASGLAYVPVPLPPGGLSVDGGLAALRRPPPLGGRPARDLRGRVAAGAA